MLAVQTYLLTHSLNDLARDHGVYARFSTKNGRKFSLNYDQLEATDADPISQDCRGLVLAVPFHVDPPGLDTVVGATEIMGWPMRRFFNYGQGAAAPVNFNDSETRFCEKLDGTLCILYFDRYMREWCVATRSVPDADLPMDGFGEQTFASLFWKSFRATGGREDLLWEGNTYCFELCTPDNQVVVRYNDYSVYLLAVRDRTDGTESLPDGWAKDLEVPVAPTYRFGSTAELLNFVSDRDASKHEGIVVVDRHFNRVKVKNAGYMALSKVRDSVAKSPRAVMEIILLGQEDDVMPLVPEHIQTAIQDTKAGLRDLIHFLDREYESLYSSDRKTFALAIQAHSGFMAPHMLRWTGKVSSAHSWIQGQRKDGTWTDGFLDTLMDMIRRIRKV